MSYCGVSETEYINNNRSKGRTRFRTRSKNTHTQILLTPPLSLSLYTNTSLSTHCEFMQGLFHAVVTTLAEFKIIVYITLNTSQEAELE